MNKTKKIISILIVSTFALFSSFALETKNEDTQKMVLLHNWGLSYAQVTRIQNNTTRSNFVWQDTMIGAFYSIQTANLPVNFVAKVDVFYPIAISFNSVPQVSKQVLVYAFDFNAGPIWTFPIGKIAKLNLAPVIDFRYQLDDNFHHFDLGAGFIAGFDFPISHFFTISLNGGFAYDFGNLGTNANVRNYNQVWSYNAQLGFRISKKKPNDFYYIGYKILN